MTFLNPLKTICLRQLKSMGWAWVSLEVSTHTLSGNMLRVTLGLCVLSVKICRTNVSGGSHGRDGRTVYWHR